MSCSVIYICSIIVILWYVFRPTHPDISVSLTLQGKGKVDMDNEFIKFDPQVREGTIRTVETGYFYDISKTVN